MPLTIPANASAPSIHGSEASATPRPPATPSAARTRNVARRPRSPHRLVASMPDALPARPSATITPIAPGWRPSQERWTPSSGATMPTASARTNAAA
jgi:hypothetical protein